MRDTIIVRTTRTVSASKLIDTIGESLSVIKEQDELNDNDLGGVLHKHRDQAAKYRTGLAEMPVTAFLRACERWNGRFANDVFALIGMKLTPKDARPQNDRSFSVLLCKLQLAVSAALENDDQIDDDELRAMRTLLTECGQAIDARLSIPLKAVGDAA